MNHGNIINAFWSKLGVPKDRVYARTTTDRIVLSFLVDGLPVNTYVDRAELKRLTNEGLARFKRTNRYKNDPEMQ